MADVEKIHSARRSMESFRIRHIAAALSATVAQAMPIALAVRSLADIAQSNVMRTPSSVDQAVLPLVHLPSYAYW